MMNLIKSGVKGLDNILKGGFKENSNILVTGAPGTGKTILCLQFANEGIKNKEPVLFVATEEFKEAIFEYAKTMGLNNLINNKLFMVLERTDLKSQIKSLTDPIKLVKQHKVKRIVFDSITFFDYLYFKNELEYRTALMDFLHEMKSNKVTTIMTLCCLTSFIESVKLLIWLFRSVLSSTMKSLLSIRLLRPIVLAYSKIASLNSSVATKSTGSLFFTPSLAYCKHKIVFPVPGAPVTKMLLFSLNPPLRMLSKPLTPLFIKFIILILSTLI